MGSLNNSQPIAQRDRVVRHNGAAVVVSQASSDGEFGTKFEKNYNDKLKQLEDSIMGMPSLSLWLDADDSLNMHLTESNKVSSWSNKTGDGVAAGTTNDTSPTFVTVDVGSGKTRGALRYNARDQYVSLNEHLDDTVTGAGQSWTMVFAFKLNEDLNDNGDFIDIITKWDDAASSIYVYIEDDSDWKTLRTELYSAGNVSNGISTIGTYEVEGDKIYIVTVVYNAAGGDNLERLSHYLNRVDNKHSSSFDFGTGLADITDNDEEFRIGKHAGSDYNGYRGSFLGDFYEFIVFNEALDSTNLKNVEHYLALKWGATKHISDLRSGAE